MQQVLLSKKVSTLFFDFKKKAKKEPSRARTSLLFVDLYKSGVIGRFGSVTTTVRSASPKYKIHISHTLPCPAALTLTLSRLETGNQQSWAIENCNEGCQCNEKEIQLFQIKHQQKYFDRVWMNVWKDFELHSGMAIGVGFHPKAGSLNFNIVKFTNEFEDDLSFVGKPLSDFKTSAFTAFRVAKEMAPQLGYQGINLQRKVLFESVGEFAPSGPSSGSLLVLMMLSLFLEKPLTNDFTCTGIIEINGKVTAIGGINEKIAVAEEANLSKFYAPLENRDDIKNVHRNIEILLTDDINQLVKLIFS